MLHNNYKKKILKKLIYPIIIALCLFGFIILYLLFAYNYNLFSSCTKHDLFISMLFCFTVALMHLVHHLTKLL